MSQPLWMKIAKVKQWNTKPRPAISFLLPAAITSQILKKKEESWQRLNYCMFTGWGPCADFQLGL